MLAGTPTTLANTRTRYGLATRVLHWLTALLILAQIPLGYVAYGMPDTTSQEIAAKAALMSVHKTVGVATVLVGLAWIGWALVQPRPRLVQAGPRALVLLAAMVHWALYLALVLVPLTGWVHHAATTGLAPILWPLGQGLPLVPRDDGVAAVAAALHGMFSNVLVALILLHVLGALKHGLIDRDGTLARMVAGRPAGAEGARRPRGAALALALAIYAAGAGAVLSQRPAAAAAPEQAAAPLAAGPGGWRVEGGTLDLTVTQLGQPVQGGVKAWSADIDFDPATGTGSVRVEVAVGSVTIGSVTAHALAPEFLDAAGHPAAVFAAVIRPEGGAFLAEGTLRLRGVEVPVALPFSLALDGDRAVMAGAVTLDRRAFGIGASQGDARTLGFEVGVQVALTAVRGG